MKFENCPICGHTPIVKTHSLDRGNGHGYPNHFSYSIICSNDDCPLSHPFPMLEETDVYRSKEECYKYLCEVWNETSNKTRKLIEENETYHSKNKERVL